MALPPLQLQLSKLQPPAICLYDLEISPVVAYSWGPKYETSLIEITQPSVILSVAWRFLGEEKVNVRALCDYPGYRKGSLDDRALVTDLHAIFSASDIVVGHNSRKFDDKVSNQRFLIHGLPPPAPYRSVDTLAVARRHFKTSSFKLDDLATELGLSRKLHHVGFALWKGCMEGDPGSWARMRAYNRQDVEILTQLFLRLRGWATNHPPLTHYTRDPVQCEVCLSYNTQLRGHTVSKAGLKQRLHCTDCGHWTTCGKTIRDGAL